MITTVTDLRTGKIYNWTTYPGMLIALVGSLATTVWIANLGDSRDLEVADVTVSAPELKTALASETLVEQAKAIRRFGSWFGFIEIQFALAGWFLAGLAMVVCYVFFAGQIGGGDIKLLAMIGAFLGVEEGLEVMLWGLVIAAGIALIRLVWSVGATRLLTQVTRGVVTLMRTRSWVALNPEERAPLQASLCLSPSALAAVIVVRADWLLNWFQLDAI